MMICRSYISPGHRCASFHLGHNVHWIQSKLSLEEGNCERCRIEEIRDDGFVVLSNGIIRWHHSATAVRKAAEALGSTVNWRGHGLLAFVTDEGELQLSTADEPSPCVPPNRPNLRLVDRPSSGAAE